MTLAHEGIRLTELLASLSLATDLGTGQPVGHGLRTSLLAVQLALDLGLGTDDVRSVHQVSLLRFLGCTADAAETASMAGGDDLAFNAAAAPQLNGSRVDLLKTLVGAVGPGQPWAKKSRMVIAALADTQEPARGLAAHCEVAAMLANRLGLADRVSTALLASYEHWDGRGYPNGLEAEAIPIEIRISMVARDIDLMVSAGSHVEELLSARRGKAYDPTVVDAYRRLSQPHPEADWESVLTAEPEPIGRVTDLGTALGVMADFADLKSPWTRGHSREVARLVAGASPLIGLSSDDTESTTYAGLVHDLGRVGVSNGIWDKAGPLSTDQWEQVRLHPYMTDRILSRCPGLVELGALASSHHERLDGSGYHRQSNADQLSTGARVLAAADVVAALTSARPHRGPLDVPSASDLARSEVKEGRLDAEAVEAVIAAAGGDARSPQTNNPNGLTDRELDVLRHVCRGLTNRQVAEMLFISPKTVGRHVENIYSKIGVSTRAGAAVYAMEHRLLD